MLATQCLLAAPREDDRGPRRRHAPPGVTAKDIILALIAKIGVGGAHRPRHRVHGRGDPRARHGRAHDGLQHVDRGRRARRHDRARRRHVRVPRRAASTRRKGAALGRRRRALAQAAHRRRRDVDRHASSRSTRSAHRADDHVRHEPGHGHPGRRDASRRRPTSPTPPQRAQLEQGAALHGPQRRASRCWASTVDVVFIGSLHQLAHRDLRAAAQRARRPQGRAGRARCSSSRARRQVKRQAEAEGLDRRLPRRPAPSGARPAARCASR